MQSTTIVLNDHFNSETLLLFCLISQQEVNPKCHEEFTVLAVFPEVSPKTRMLLEQRRSLLNPHSLQQRHLGLSYSALLRSDRERWKPSLPLLRMATHGLCPCQCPVRVHLGALFTTRSSSTTYRSKDFPGTCAVCCIRYLECSLNFLRHRAR